jgi:tagatose 1,6-diphosphate aldolase
MIRNNGIFAISRKGPSLNIKEKCRMKTISIGKYRGLQQCSTSSGAISVMALDHRNNLRAALRPEAPDSVTGLELTEFKQKLVKTLAPHASAVLLDPQYGSAQSIAAGALPGFTGLLVAVEASGYTGDPTKRQSRVLPGWSVAKTKRMGANAVKLLVYYHPDGSTAAEIEDLVREVAQACEAADLPMFLEPLSYSLNPERKKLSPEERRYVVIETARRLSPLGADVLKVEFPFDIQTQPDEREWRLACEALSAASQIPWVLLSASVAYGIFLRQVSVACLAGASGVAVGRAVWQEAPLLKDDAQKVFLHDIAAQRMRRITGLCEALAKPWTDFYTSAPVDEKWYEGYPS